VKDTIELIKTLDTRMVNSNTNLADQVNKVVARIKDIEQNVVLTLKSMSSAGDEGNFSAHEETILRIQEQYISMNKQLLEFQSKIASQVEESLKLSNNTRQDYSDRMTELYREHSNL
jgi:hypothetical protein